VAIPPSPLFLPIEVGGEPGLLVAVPNTSIRMIVPVSCLTEVSPPLPEEPPNGFVGRLGDTIWARIDSTVRTDSPARWLEPGNGHAFAWEQVCGFRPGEQMIALVPDPVDDAPELPLRIYSDGRELLRVTPWPSAENPCTGILELLVDAAELTPDDLDGVGSALLRIARDARRTQNNTQEGRSNA
jgi:hypothetical protein